MAELSFGLFIR